MVIVYNCGAAGCRRRDSRARRRSSTRCPPIRSVHAGHRVILAPDPTLPVRWAATAWTWTLRADCFDEAAFGQFYADHYGHGLGERSAAAARPTPTCATASSGG